MFRGVYHGSTMVSTLVVLFPGGFDPVVVSVLPFTKESLGWYWSLLSSACLLGGTHRPMDTVGADVVSVGERPAS